MDSNPKDTIYFVGPGFGYEPDKWEHCVTGKDGCIYCPPSNSKNVLRIDPSADETMAAALFGPECIEGGQKWAMSVVGKEGTIYCVPQDASRVLQIFTTPSSMSRQPVQQLDVQDIGEEESKWLVAVAGNNSIYCPPHCASKVLHIDPSKDKVKVVGPDLGPLPCKWTSGVLAADNCVYCPPCMSSRVLRIDTVKGVVDFVGPEFGSDRCKWGSAQLGHDGCVYGIPQDHSQVLQIMPGGHVQLIGPKLGDGDSKWLSSAMAKDGCIYSPPCQASQVLRIDTTTAAVELIGTSLKQHGDTDLWKTAVLGLDDCVYCAPARAKKVLRIDPQNLLVDVVGPEDQNCKAGFDRYHSALMSRDGRIWCIPSGSSRIMCIRTAPNVAEQEQAQIRSSVTRGDIGVAVGDENCDEFAGYDDAVSFPDSDEDDDDNESGISYGDDVIREEKNVVTDGDGDSVILDPDDDAAAGDKPSPKVAAAPSAQAVASTGGGAASSTSLVASQTVAAPPASTPVLEPKPVASAVAAKASAAAAPPAKATAAVAPPAANADPVGTARAVTQDQVAPQAPPQHPPQPPQSMPPQHPPPPQQLSPQHQVSPPPLPPSDNPPPLPPQQQAPALPQQPLQALPPQQQPPALPPQYQSQAVSQQLPPQPPLSLPQQQAMGQHQPAMPPQHQQFPPQAPLTPQQRAMGQHPPTLPSQYHPQHFPPQSPMMQHPQALMSQRQAQQLPSQPPLSPAQQQAMGQHPSMIPPPHQPQQFAPPVPPPPPHQRAIAQHPQTSSPQHQPHQFPPQMPLPLSQQEAMGVHLPALPPQQPQQLPSQALLSSSQQRAMGQQPSPLPPHHPTQLPPPTQLSSSQPTASEPATKLTAATSEQVADAAAPADSAPQGLAFSALQQKVGAPKPEATPVPAPPTPVYATQDELTKMKGAEQFCADQKSDVQLARQERDRLIQAENDAEAAHQANMHRAEVRANEMLASLEEQIATKEKEVATKLAEAEKRMQNVESALDTKNRQLTQFTNDFQMQQQKLRDAVEYAHQMIYHTEREVAQQREAQLVAQARHHDSEMQAVTRSLQEKLAIEKRHLVDMEEIAQQRRLHDLEDLQTKLQSEHDMQAKQEENKWSEAVDRAHESQNEAAEQASAELAAADQQEQEAAQAAEKQLQEDMAKAQAIFEFEVRKLQGQLQSDLAAKNQHYENIYEALTIRNQEEQEGWQYRIHEESQEVQRLKDELEEKQQEVVDVIDTSEQQHQSDIAEIERKLAKDRENAKRALKTAEIDRNEMLARQHQHDEALFAKWLTEERRNAHAEFCKREAKLIRQYEKVRDECAEECERVRTLSEGQQGPIRAVLPKPPKYFSREVARQRLFKAYDSLQRRLRGCCTPNGTPLPGVRARLLAPLSRKATRPSMGTSLDLLKVVADVVALHGVNAKDVSLFWYDGNECSICQSSIGQWESVAPNGLTKKGEWRIGCEIQIFSRASVHDVLQVLANSVQVQDRSVVPPVRQALINAGACHVAPVEVDSGWPLQRIEAVLAIEHPECNIGPEPLERLTRAIGASAEACRQAISQIKEGTEGSMQSLCALKDLVQSQGKLLSEKDVKMKKEDKLAQDAKYVDALMADAERAHRKLKAALAPLTTWARSDFDNDEVSSKDPRRFFVSSPQYLLPKGEIYDPGVQNQDDLWNTALTMQREYEPEPPWQALTDVSRLIIVFDSASDLLDGLEQLYDRFDVLWIKNGFRHPQGVWPCKMTVGVKQKIPHVHISELHLHLRQMLNFEQSIGQKHIKGIQSIIWSCNVSSNMFDSVLKLVCDTMYRTDGQLMKDASDEVERIQSQCRQDGIRSEEAAALINESRGYATAFAHVRDGSMAKPLAIAPAPAVQASPELASPDFKPVGLSDTTRCFSPAGYSDITTRCSTPQQHSKKSRATTPQPHSQSTPSHQNMNGYQPALKYRGNMFGRCVGDEHSPSGRRALSARAPRVASSSARSGSARERSARERQGRPQALPQVTN